MSITANGHHTRVPEVKRFQIVTSIVHKWDEKSSKTSIHVNWDTILLSQFGNFRNRINGSRWIVGSRSYQLKSRSIFLQPLYSFTLLCSLCSLFTHHTNVAINIFLHQPQIDAVILVYWNMSNSHTTQVRSLQ